MVPSSIIDPKYSIVQIHFCTNIREVKRKLENISEIDAHYLDLKNRTIDKTAIQKSKISKLKSG